MHLEEKLDKVRLLLPNTEHAVDRAKRQGYGQAWVSLCLSVYNFMLLPTIRI